MLQESQLYWYKVLFLFELLAAEGIFSFKLRRRNHFPVRVLVSVGICLIFAVFYPLMDYTVMYNSGIFFAIQGKKFALCRFSPLFDCAIISHISLCTFTIVRRGNPWRRPS